jgi:hypothetical protein
MSFRIDSSVAADTLTLSRYSRCSSSSGESRARSVIPMMPFIGVRISWLMFARNSLLARLAAIARSRAMTSAWFALLSSAVRAATAASSRSCCSWFCVFSACSASTMSLKPRISSLTSSLPVGVARRS